MEEKLKKDMKEFLSALIKFKTVAENKEELEKCAKFLVKKAEDFGLEAEIIHTKVPNVLIKREGKGKKVAFVTHFDVVPAGEGWNTDPFTPVFKDGKIFGRGACDDKGHVVSAFYSLVNAEELNINPVLAIAGGEETQRSKEFFREIAKKVDLAIVNDTGPLSEIHIGSSGFLGYYIKIKGKQGHSAYHYLFDDPILKLDVLIKRLKEMKDYALNNFVSEFGGRGYERIPVRIFPTVIESKPKVINIVPSEVEVLVNIRSVPEYNNDFIEKFFKERLKDLNVELKKHEIELKAWITKAEEVDKFKEVVKNVLRIEPKLGIMPGGSDGIHFFEQGCKVIEYGFAKDAYRIHGPNEFVELEDMLKLYKVLKYIMEKGI
jgi:succinyl-diaminopimelate desuccinylase